MDQYIGIINKLLGSDLSIVYIDSFTYSKTNNSNGKEEIFTQEAKKYIDDKGNDAVKASLLKLGYYFPGTWADKSTIIAFKINKDVDLAKVNAFGDLYYKAMQNLQLSGAVTEDYNVPFSKTAKVGTSEIIRTLIEDIKLGGRFDGENFQSALFNPKSKDTYDLIKIFKRAYVVAPLFTLNQENASNVALDVIQDTYGDRAEQSGIVINKDGTLSFRTYIFNVNSSDFVFEYAGKEYNIKQVLTDAFGTDCTDGAFIFGLGGFDTIWRKLSGSLKEGAIKLWGHNSLEGNFSTPFYLKTAGHGFSQKDIIVQWMRANNISLLVSDSATKVNGYGSNGLSNKIDQNVIELPLANLERIMEKDDHQETARGLKQSITANLMVENNPIMKTIDPENRITKIFKGLVDKLIEDYEQQATNIDGNSMLEYIKKICINPTNNRERAISNIFVDMLYTYADSVLQDRQNLADQEISWLEETKDTLEPETIAKREEDIKELLANTKDAKNKVTVANEALANKLGKILFHPYFEKLFESKMNGILEDLLFYEVPSTYSVICPDLGVLASTRYEAIQTAMKANIKAKEEIRDRQNEAIQKDIDQTQKTIDYYETVETTEPELKKAKIKELVKVREEFQAKLKTNQKEFSIDKMMANVTYEDSGRLKPDYTMLTQDIADRFNIKIGDNVLTIAVPSDSMQSMNAPYVVALLDKTQASINCIVCNSEYLQSQVGKDYDLDTLLVVPYSDKFKSLNDFQYLAESIRKIKGAYKPLIKKQYEDLLLRDITDKEVFSKAIRLEYLQALYGKEKSKEIYNPLLDQSLLDKYKKLIANIVNRRAMVTMKNALGFTAQGSFRWGTWQLSWNIDYTLKTNMLKSHVAHLGETNAQVDIPNDDTALKYNSLNPIAQYFIDNNLHDQLAALRKFIRTLDTKEQKKFEKALKGRIETYRKVDEILFRRLAIISSDKNVLEHGSERDLTTNMTYLYEQKILMNLLKTDEGKKKIVHDFLDKNDTMGALYLTSMNLKNDMNSFIPMYLINKTNLELFPSITQSDSLTNNLAVEEMTNTSPFLTKIVDRIKNTPSYVNNLNNIEKKYGKEAKFVRGMFLFTTVGKNPNLHLLKGKLLRVINSHSTLFANEKQESLSQWDNGLAVAVDNAIWSSRILKSLLTVNSLVINDGYQDTKTSYEFYDKELKFKGILEIEFQNNGSLRFSLQNMAKKELYSIYHQDLQGRLDVKDTKAMMVGRLLFDREGIFGFGKGKNRYDFSLRVNATKSINLDKRYDLANEILNEEYGKLEPTDKFLLWASLSATTTGELSNETLSNSGNNNRLWGLLEGLEDEESREFIKRYFGYYHNQITHGFNSVLEVKSAMYQDKDVDEEIYTMFGLESTDTTISQEADRMNDDKNKKPLDSAYILPVYNKNTGLKLMGLEDISSLVTPIDLLGKLRVNEIDAYKAGALTIIGEVEKIVTATKIAQLRITTLLNDVIRTGKFNTTDILKHTKIKQLKEQVFKAVEANTRGINIVKSTTGYTYSAQGLQAESAKELAVLLQLNPQDSSMFQIECEYHKLYSVDNIETISNIIGYLEDIFSRVTLPSQKHLIKSILDKYKRQEKALVSRKFNYMPHIIPENVYKTVVMLDMKRAEIEAIQQEIADAKAWQLANPNLPISKTYLDLIAIENDQEAINRMAVERIEKENSGYGVGSVGQYVNAHMLKRKYGTEISGITIVDMDTGIHSIHANQFIKAIKNDLLFVNHLLFENEYLMNGNNPDSKLFKRMLHHTAELTGNRLLASKEIDTKEIKAGMEISFFYPVAHKALNNFANMGKNYYSGTIKKVDAKFIYVKMDRKKFVGFINEKLKEYSRIHNNIKNSPLGITNATIGQLALIDDFINQGYLMPNFYPKTMIEASELIINTLQQILDNKESWGKFRKDNLYRRNLQGVKGQELASGVYRYLPYTNGGKNISTGINYLHGLARELNNRYDNKFHEEGWSSLANISTALGFIKYQALEILPNLTQGARWLQAKVGLSTPAAGLHNYLQGITSIMRDRGISNFVVTQKEVRVISNKVKIAMKENNIQYYIDIADNFLQNTNAQGYQESDKSNIIAGLAFKNMFESGVLFEDFLMNNITGDNTLIEKDVIKYTVNEKYNTIRQKIIDSVGYKKYKEEKSRIFEELIKETNPTKITSLMVELTKLENGWKIKKDEIFAKKEKFLSSFLSKAEIKSIKDINLSEAEDKTTTDIAKGVGLDFYHLPFFSYMIGTGFFSRVEGHLRRNATIFYILDEFNKGNFDETKIHNNVMKGIARTQAMYDDINRRLGDRSKIGKFFYMFGQYPMFTWDVYKRMIRAYKESDDPRDKELIRKKMVNEFAIDVMYTGANAMFQGLKLGHPVNLIGYSALIAMINLFGVLFDEPEEDDKNKSLLQRFMENYEMKEFIFSLLSFRLGMGHTLLLNMGYNAILGEEKRKEQTKKESIAKRDGKTVKPLTSVPPVVSMGRLGSTFQILERTNRLMYETITGNKAKVNAWQDKKDMRMFEKYFSPFNLLAPVGYKQADLDYYLYTQKTLAERLLQAGELAIPLFAGIKYKTDLPIYGTTTNAEYEKQLEQKAEERKKVNYQEHIDEMKAKGKGYIEIKEYEDQYRQRQSDIENGYKDSSGKLTEKGKRMRKGNGLFKFRF